MPIDLSDIPIAVGDYLDNHVTTVVSAVSSGGTIEDGETGTFSVTVTNAGAPDGVRLVNLRWHLTISPATVAKLVADTSALAPKRATIDPDGPTLAFGELTDVMLPLHAKPGDRVRLRLQRSRLLKLASAAEAPVLCPSNGPCE